MKVLILSMLFSPSFASSNRSIAWKATDAEGSPFRIGVRGVGRLQGVLVKSVINHANVRPWKNFHRGQTGVLFANGKSLDRYVHRDHDELGIPVVTFGTNGVIYTGLPVDHLFVADTRVWPTPETSFNHKHVKDFRARSQKWFCYWRKKPDHGPSVDAAARAEAKLFEADGPHTASSPLVKDVGNYIFASMSSSSLFALQFALYSGVDRLFIVGLDLTNSSMSATKRQIPVPGSYAARASQYFQNSLPTWGRKRLGKINSSPLHFRHQVAMWQIAAQFANTTYPKTKVYLVNPPYLLGSKTAFIDINVTKGPLPFISTESGGGLGVQLILNRLLILGILLTMLALMSRKYHQLSSGNFIVVWWTYFLDEIKNRLLPLATVQWFINNPEVLLIVGLVTPVAVFVWDAFGALGEIIWNVPFVIFGMLSGRPRELVMQCFAYTEGVFGCLYEFGQWLRGPFIDFCKENFWEPYLECCWDPLMSAAGAASSRYKEQSKPTDVQNGVDLLDVKDLQSQEKD
eukprot:CAMPEP_0114239914 /NCGR_PEP_ID=MMETSP0058-20121206/8734_1 /TAXON_ID=36894 /ORGANISM="Pyramimonas parkeae, CCMP726" /LENGTH=515 /DNA_ID=CAMNT_0001352167 /DNA_START=67 /DNA_END=1614 /DNA_ORIENTATION=+